MEVTQLYDSASLDLVERVLNVPLQGGALWVQGKVAADDVGNGLHSPWGVAAQLPLPKQAGVVVCHVLGDLWGLQDGLERQGHKHRGQTQGGCPLAWGLWSPLPWSGRCRGQLIGRPTCQPHLWCSGPWQCRCR